MEFLQDLAFAFIPLFVATDPFGAMPFFVGATHDLPPADVRRVARHAVLTAGIVGLIFLFLGKGILLILGITVGDFKVAGGLLLLVLAVNDLLSSEKTLSKPQPDAGIVPIGIPLVLGPAVLTNLFMLVDTRGFAATLLAFVAILAVVAVLFDRASLLVAWMGTNGVRATSKVLSVLLAAIGVMMVRQGVVELIQSGYFKT